MNFNNISFILHKPQLSDNIGLCARAMKNFGFKNLSVIEPKPIFPNDKIIATSVGAKDVLKNGFNLFTEKPMSPNYKQGKLLVNIAKSNNLYLLSISNKVSFPRFNCFRKIF